MKNYESEKVSPKMIMNATSGKQEQAMLNELQHLESTKKNEAS